MNNGRFEISKLDIQALKKQMNENGAMGRGGQMMRDTLHGILQAPQSQASLNEQLEQLREKVEDMRDEGKPVSVDLLSLASKMVSGEALTREERMWGLTLRAIANSYGLYDAADLISSRVS